VKFLHRRMGFDVLAWESGFYELRLAQAAMRGGGDPVAAAKRGVFTIWSNAREVQPLFEYVQASQGTTRPIDMVGLHIQVTAAGVDERFAADVRAFAAGLHDPARRRDVGALVEQTLSTYERLRTTPASADLDGFLGAAGALLTAIDRDRAAFETAHGAMEVGFMERALDNMRGRGANLYNRRRPDPPATAVVDSEEWNRRDRLMADNLRWVMEQGYPGRKVIVWAHNAHLMNGHFAADWRSVHATAQRDGMTPTGLLVAEWLKDDVYTIATTTYVGEEHWTNGQRRGTIAPAAPGSLESRLHRLGMPQLFLDLRPARGVNGHPLRRPLSMRVSGYGPPTGEYGNDLVPDLAAAFDAVFYVDRMAPATPLDQGPGR
jgi:erythromycin esterase